MKNNNKGFSLVELLVSFAILGVVSVLIGIIMTSGSRMFASNRARLSLQYKSQVISSQIHTYIQNCNGGLAVDSNGDLYIAQKTPGAGDVVGYIYLLAKGEGDDADGLFLKKFDVKKQTLPSGDTVYVGAYETASGGSASADSFTASDVSACLAQPMCSDVASWNTELAPKYAKVTINFSQENAKYSKNIVESFRNRPAIVKTSDVSGDSTLLNILKERVWG